MKGSLFGVLAVSVVLAGCGGGAALGASQAPKLVPDSALAGSLLSADELNAIMGTSGMTPHPPVGQMGDHRNLLLSSAVARTVDRSVGIFRPAQRRLIEWRLGISQLGKDTDRVFSDRTCMGQA